VSGPGRRSDEQRTVSRPARPLAAGALAAYALSLVPGAVGLVGTLAVTVGAVAALVLPLRSRRHPHAPAWYAFAGSFALFGLAGTAAHLTTITGQASAETIPLNALGFGLFLAGQLQLARDRRGGRAVADLIDITVIGAGVSIAVWRVLWYPRLAEDTVGTYFFIALVVLSVVLGARLRITAQRERRQGLHPGSAPAGLLILASAYPVAIAGAATVCGLAGPVQGILMAIAWPLSAALLAVAIGEPVPASDPAPTPEVEAPIDQWRLLLIGSATPVPLVVGLTTDLNGAPGGYVFGLGIVMTILVTLRTGLAFRRVHQELGARTAAEAELHQQERYDSLTGLANRTLFRTRLDEAMARADTDGQLLAVLYLDLDRFKVINDSFGQRAGDEALVVVADRLREAVRDHDTPARLSGDEFAVILERLGGAEDAVEIAERIREAVRAPIAVAGTSVVVGTSIGLSVYDNQTEAADVLREADVALSDAKRQGRNAVVAFDASLRADIAQALSFEHDLAGAVDRGELRLHYQPQIDLRTGAVCGVEALIRWQHPTHGMLSPAAFIEIAEDTGLIVPIGAWVIEEACRQHRRWQAVLGPERVPAISINVSPTQLSRDDVSGRVQRALHAAGLDPSQLHVEITEVVLMGDSERAIAALEAIDDQGVAIAVDDFGTGYFSLSHLRRFPVNVIKIDQSFVQGIGASAEDQAIIDATIDLAHALGLVVVAEGVETAEQLAYLRAKGCDTVQGYYFAKPLPPDELAAFVGDRADGNAPVVAPVIGAVARSLSPRRDGLS
jgi:diguanylate cyclase (GGDEF)-like protein